MASACPGRLPLLLRSGVKAPSPLLTEVRRRYTVISAVACVLGGATFVQSIPLVSSYTLLG